MLIVGRRRLKGAITRIMSLAERLSATQTKDGIDVLLDRLDLAWSEFEKIGDRISLHDAVDGYVDPADDYEEYEGRYLGRGSYLSQESAHWSHKQALKAMSQCRGMEMHFSGYYNNNNRC